MTKTAFSTLSLPSEQLSNIKSLGYEEMTPIQAEGLPAILEGKDLLAQADKALYVSKKEGKNKVSLYSG